MSRSPSPPPVGVVVSPTHSPVSRDEYEAHLLEEGIPATYVYASFFGALIASLIAFFNISKHLLNYTNPGLQKTIIRILFIVPNFAIFSWLGLAFPRKSVIFESVRDVYEAFVIYEFLKLILAYCGGEAACIEILMKKPGSISHMWPMNYCLPRMQLNARFFRWTKRLTLQFVIVKPVMAAGNIVYFELGDSSSASYHTWSTVQLWLYNISYTLALYGLLLFYFASHHHPGLMSRRPIFKFFSVKMIVFATYYQALLVGLVGSSGAGLTKHYLEQLNNFVFCFEMIIFAIAHVIAFGWGEFVGGTEGIGDALNENGMPPSFAVELTESGKHSSIDSLKSGVRNLKEVANVKDVVGDAVESFSNKYDEHVKLDTTDRTEAFEQDDTYSHNPFEKVAPATDSYAATSSSSYKAHPATYVSPVQPRQQPAGSSTPHEGGSGGQVHPEANPFKQDNPFQTDLI